jgi:hypothetical protein
LEPGFFLFLYNARNVTAQACHCEAAIFRRSNLFAMGQTALGQNLP